MRRLLLTCFLAPCIVYGCKGTPEVLNHTDDDGSGGMGGSDNDDGLEHTGGNGASEQGGHGGEGETGGEPGSGLKCDAPSACGLTECEAPLEEGNHSALCAELTPHTNPPTSGEHYPKWAAFGIYDQPIPDGFLLHSLEHGAVALLYNCDLIEDTEESCADFLAELVAFYEAWPDDALCSDVPHRLIIAPDPKLDTAFAATAWGYHLKGDCFDAPRVTDFIEAHYAKNYEDLCNPGIGPDDTDCWP